MLNQRFLSLSFKIGFAGLAVAIFYSIKLTSIISIFLFILWLAEGNWQSKLKEFKTNKWLHLFILFYFLHIIGLAYTQNINAGLFELEKKLSLILFPIIIGTSTTLKSELELRPFLHKWFIIGCCTSLTYCIAHGFYRFSNGIPPSTSIYGGFEATQQFQSANAGISNIWEYLTYTELLSPLALHPTYVSLFLLLGISITINYAIKSLQKDGKFSDFIVLALIIAFFSFSIILLASRIAIVLFVVVIMLYCINYLRYKFSTRTMIVGSSIVLIFISILGYSIPVVKHRFTNDLSMFNQTYDHNNPGTGLRIRLEIWKSAITVFKDNPLLGVGTGDLEDVMDTEYTRRNSPTLKGYNAHNQFLQTSIMLGIIGGVTLLLMLFLPMILAMRRNDFHFFVFLLIISVSFLTESILQSNKGIVFYALFNSIYLFYTPPKQLIE